jgi:hypothetical protein
MATAHAQCVACGGTGLYQGMCEGNGRAVVCLDCNGTACKEIEYRPFSGRVRPNGMGRLDHLKIQQSSGRLIIGPIGGAGEEMSYEEFRKRFPTKEAP